MHQTKTTFNLFFMLFCGQFLFASLPVTDGLIMHLDADSITGLSNGDPVSLWSDLSGADNHATQTTTTAQPVYTTSVLDFNGMPAVYFDGSSDWLALPSPAPFNVGAVTMFAVAKFIPDGNDQYMVAGQDGGGDDRIRFAISGGFEFRIGSTEYKSINTGFSDDTVHIFEINSTAEGFLDGSSVGTAGNGSTEIPVALNIGSYNLGQKDFFEGDLAELIIYNRLLTDVEQNEIGVYLENKYGLDTDYATVVPQVHSPNPANGTQNVSLDDILQWQAPVDVNSPTYNVYFDTAEAFPTLVSEGQTETAYDPYGTALMQTEQIYNWRVDIQGVSEGPVWSFATRTESVTSLREDLNEDSIVDIQDLYTLAQRWLDYTTEPVDINQSGKVDNGDFACLSSSWKKEGPFPDSYVISRYSQGDFKVAYDDQICSIYIDSADDMVCQIAAECLADDIERVCGMKPSIVHDTAGLSGHVIFIGTLGNSAGIDAFVSDGTVDVSDVTGQWETFALDVVDNPVGSVECGLVISGSDRRGTAYGVFDLSEKMGVSPWFWWADVPVRCREQVIVRDGRYKEGPPSVKYRGIFINDEDWGLDPWARDTYAPEDEYIGPKTYQKVFELLLRLKANHIWPAMHDCTKAFNAFEDNKVIADEYGIVMGSSHCEQMLRNNVWEWYEWSPEIGSRGSWDWCTNSDQITEYWEDRVEVNAPYENVYTTGMRGIHDGSMPCSGATNAQKVQKMEDEIFPAQQQMLADWVNPDPSTVPQIFCPYKEVLDLYNMDMEVPDHITLAWPDDNHGYIRRLSNSTEQTRSGRSGVYYHMSYWGSPHDYLWICSTPPALIWEEMKKAYDYTADRVWVFNVGDIKPAEICMEFALRLAWDIDCVDNSNIQDYLEQWAWRQFGPEHKQQIADVMVKYYRLGLTRKPEHMSSEGAEFSMIDYGDEAQQRIDAYQTLADEADAIYQTLPVIYKDAFFQLVLYPVRGASLMNQKILYAKKSIQYAAQGRASANDCAAMSQSAYNQIISETDFYNDTVAGGKWKYMMSYNPRGLAVFNMPSTSTVTPVSGASMGIILEGQTSDITDPNNPSGLWYGTVSGNINTTTANPKMSITKTLSETEDSIAADTTEIYTGEIYDADGNISFTEDIDDKTRLYIDDNLVLSSDTWSDRVSTSNLFLSAGWHTFELRISNGSGGSGPHSSPGFGYDPTGGTNWSHPEDPGDASLFKHAIDGGTSTATNLLGFDVFTQNSHFIDIFNKGDTAFSWTATPSDAWIQLDQSSGTVDMQQRIWVSIDWDQVPLGENSGTINITGAGSVVDISLSAFNPTSPRPDDITGFVQSNGYVSMEAEHYTSKTDRSGAGWEAITTLGRSGDTMAVFPTTTPSRDQTADILANSPILEYQVFLFDAGQQNVNVHCIPTHAITSERGLRYAVAFDDQTPQIVEYDTAEWSSQWSINVLQGAAVSESTHTVSSPGSHTLKIWMVDPGVVIDKIIIGNAPTSHVGPPETVIQ